MSRTRDIRWGVLGTGWVAQRFMADLGQVSGARLAAVASRSEDRAKEMAGRFGAARAHASYEALVADADVDVVYVATEHHEHTGHVLSCLAQGKHVLCEKPFTTSLADTDRVIAAARASGRFCMEGMWTRFLPAAIEAKRRIDAGEIGVARLLTADFGVPVVSDGPSRFFDPARGGGALLDRGVYAISLAVWLFGAPTEVRGMAQLGDSGVDESASVVLRFKDDRLAVLACSLVAYSSNEAVIAGSTGRVRLQAPLACPERLTVEGAPLLIVGDAKSDLRPRSPKERARRLLARTKPYLPDGLRRTTVLRRPVVGYGYGHEAAEVVRCVRERLAESPLMPLAETRTVAAILDELRAQFQSGR